MKTLFSEIFSITWGNSNIRDKNIIFLWQIYLYFLIMETFDGFSSLVLVQIRWTSPAWLSPRSNDERWTPRWAVEYMKPKVFKHLTSSVLRSWNLFLMTFLGLQWTTIKLRAQKSYFRMCRLFQIRLWRYMSWEAECKPTWTLHSVCLKLHGCPPPVKEKQNRRGLDLLAHTRPIVVNAQSALI